jgi:hypothetical protein
MRRFLSLLLLLAMIAIQNPRQAPACAVVPRSGQSVGVNGEEAVIVFDAKSGTEHFIRRANFQTEAPDFGFLVPTPTKPELFEVNASIFGMLDAATAPRHVFSGTTHRVVRKKNFGESDAMAAKAPAAPTILEEKKVAGYEAIVLRADDLDGLKKWLEEHKYDARPAVMNWLKWYVDNQWIITAFKVSPEPKAKSDRWAKSVRMSFAAKAPFYPYREPEDVREKPAPEPRTLRVFFLGDERCEGTLGQSGAWAGKTVWANECPEDTAKSVVKGFGMNESDAKPLAARKWHLTEFMDESSPRPGTDEVYFRPAKDQSSVERPVIYFDRYDYVNEEDAPKEDYGLSVILGVAAVALAAIATLGYLVVLRNRQSPQAE